jgi:hypothetical protein
MTKNVISNHKLSPSELTDINYKQQAPSLDRKKILDLHHENLKKLSLDEALEYDIKMFEKTITCPDNAPREAIESAEILKRLAKFLGNTEFELTNFSTPQNINSLQNMQTLPVASLLTHGGRIIIAVPRGKGEQLVNAIKGDAKLESRLTSTHDISLDSKGNFKEENGKFIGLKNSFSSKGQNRGLDINIGGYNTKDIHGEIIGNGQGATGANGHILFFTTSKDDKDFILVGIEGSAPQKHGTYGFHGLGKKNKLSAFGTVKMDKIETIFDNDKYIIPGKESMRIKLNENQVDEIIPKITSSITPVPYDQPSKLKGGVESYINQKLTFEKGKQIAAKAQSFRASNSMDVVPNINLKSKIKPNIPNSL